MTTMVYENFQNQSVLLKAFCVMNPTTYMYNICGYRMTNGIVVGTIMYGMKSTGVPIISCMDIGNDQMTNDIRIVIGPSLEILIFYYLFITISTV